MTFCSVAAGQDIQTDDSALIGILSDAIDAIMEAYRDVGIRATVALDQPEVAEVEKYPFLGRILPDDLRQTLSRPPQMSGEDLLDMYRDFLSRWHGAEGL